MKKFFFLPPHLGGLELTTMFSKPDKSSVIPCHIFNGKILKQWCLRFLSDSLLLDISPIQALIVRKTSLCFRIENLTFYITEIIFGDRLVAVVERI